jgi:hypothetical protein
MPSVGFELTIPLFEWTKRVHALDRVATVTGIITGYTPIIFSNDIGTLKL